MTSTLWAIFLTGLTVGGLTCLAVQGGLLASVVATREEDGGNRARATWAVIYFLIAKLLAYTVFGAVLGAFGGMIDVEGSFQTVMQLIAGVYMVLVALNLFNVHPIFRYVIFQPPRVLTRAVKNQAKSKDIFAPALLGAMTILIPCGTTLAMEVLAISSANAATGAAIMLVYILGTVPVFLGMGALGAWLGSVHKQYFLKGAAVLVFGLGVFSIHGAMVALDSPLTVPALIDRFTTVADSGGDSTDSSSGVSSATSQEVQISITDDGYRASTANLQVNVPVTLKLVNEGAFSCAAAFRIPSYKVGKTVYPGESATITFTPTRKGRLQYSCSMGMYTGSFNVQ